MLIDSPSISPVRTPVNRQKQRSLSSSDGEKRRKKASKSKSRTPTPKKQKQPQRQQRRQRSRSSSDERLKKSKEAPYVVRDWSHSPHQRAYDNYPVRARRSKTPTEMAIQKKKITNKQQRNRSSSDSDGRSGRPRSRGQSRYVRTPSLGRSGFSPPASPVRSPVPLVTPQIKKSKGNKSI